jgi:transposase InsO family protein
MSRSGNVWDNAAMESFFSLGAPLAQFLEQHQQGQADTLKTNTRGTIGWPA